MGWTANGTRYIVCNGEKTECTGLQGTALVRKIKEIAKRNNISKFDLYDGDGEQIQSSEVETGDFVGNLTIAKYNVAA